jgi:hypothetical protein
MFPELGSEVRYVEFKTQKAYGQEQPDITVIAPGYLIFVEVKVSAELRNDQLSRYRAILEKEKGSRTGILVLLSCLPSTKLDSKQADVAILWRQVAKWLEDALNSGTVTSDTSKYLIEQFIKFLYMVCGFSNNRKSRPILTGINDEFQKMLQKNRGEIREIDELDNYPRLQALLMMMDEAITAIQAQPRQLRKGSFNIFEHARYDFVGYDMQDPPYSFYIGTLGKECKLLFTTWACKIDVKRADQGRFGHIAANPDRWEAELIIDGQDELNANEPEDRIRIREFYQIRELDRIRNFYQQSYEFAQTIIKK